LPIKNAYALLLKVIVHQAKSFEEGGKFCSLPMQLDELKCPVNVDAFYIDDAQFILL
jgi:hypothetical protein